MVLCRRAACGIRAKPAVAQDCPGRSSQSTARSGVSRRTDGRASSSRKPSAGYVRVWASRSSAAKAAPPSLSNSSPRTADVETSRATESTSPTTSRSQSIEDLLGSKIPLGRTVFLAQHQALTAPEECIPCCPTPPPRSAFHRGSTPGHRSSHLRRPSGSKAALPTPRPR